MVLNAFLDDFSFLEYTEKLFLPQIKKKSEVNFYLKIPGLSNQHEFALISIHDGKYSMKKANY